MQPEIRPPISGESELEPRLIEAFCRYELALQHNDVATLNEMFSDGPRTTRTDGRRLLVGHAEIANFRSARSGAPSRRLQRIVGRRLGDDFALLTAVTADGDATGAQTQVWHRGIPGWRVIAAHVSLPPRPSGVRSPSDTITLGPAVWRAFGYPLLRPQGRGPLDRVGVAVKDLFAVAGQPIGAGNPSYLTEAPVRDRHAAVVERLLDLGAHVVGINPTDEFAYSLEGDNSHLGTPPNIAALVACQGGSSGATAAAVAAGLADLGLGTDTAGSIRVPASYQGLFGLRTSHGVLGVDGLLPLAPSFDAVGFLTREPRLLATVTDALLPQAASGNRNLAILDVTAVGVDAAVAAAYTTRLEQLVASGIFSDATPLDLDPGTLSEWQEAFRVVQAYEAGRSHGEWISRHPSALGGAIADRFRTAAGTTDEQAQAAAEITAVARSTLREILSERVIALPTTPAGAPPVSQVAAAPHRGRLNTVRLTCLASLAGAPAVSMPVLTADQLPVGLSLVSAPGSDAGLAELTTDVWNFMR